MPKKVSLLDNAHLGRNLFAVNVIHSDLSAERWVFYYFDDRHALTINEYLRLSRPSKRHGWKVVDCYQRLRGSHNQYGHNMDQPPLPEDVKKEAVIAFLDKLKVCMWEEVGR